MSIEDQLSGLAGGLPDGISEGVALGTGLADGYDLYASPLGEVVVTFNTGGRLVSRSWPARATRRGSPTGTVAACSGPSLLPTGADISRRRWRQGPPAVCRSTSGRGRRSRTGFSTSPPPSLEVRSGPMVGWPGRRKSQERPERSDRRWPATRSRSSSLATEWCDPTDISASTRWVGPTTSGSCSPMRVWSRRVWSSWQSIVFESRAIPPRGCIAIPRVMSSGLLANGTWSTSPRPPLPNRPVSDRARSAGPVSRLLPPPVASRGLWQTTGSRNWRSTP